MITEERLEELIKQNGMVYFGTYNEDNVFILRKIKLSHCYILDNELHDEQECCYYDFADLFETKEQAKWHCKVDAERIERFEPPMWEDLPDYYEFHFRHHCYGFVDFVVRKNNFICIDNEEGSANLFSEYGVRADKENYEKACEIVRDLFKGEK